MWLCVSKQDSSTGVFGGSSQDLYQWFSKPWLAYKFPRPGVRPLPNGPKMNGGYSPNYWNWDIWWSSKHQFFVGDSYFQTQFIPNPFLCFNWNETTNQIILRTSSPSILVKIHLEFSPEIWYPGPHRNLLRCSSNARVAAWRSDGMPWESYANQLRER